MHYGKFTTSRFVQRVNAYSPIEIQLLHVIEDKISQLANALFPIISHLGILTLVNPRHVSKVAEPIIEHSGRETVFKEVHHPKTPV